jgi:hypothetical protein
VGTYDRIIARATIAVAPDDPHNSIIVDIDRAPHNPQGVVRAVADVEILRPTVAANGNRRLLYDVVNRGNKVAQSAFIGGGGLTTGAAPDDAFPSILRAGYTVVWSGWQGDIAQSGDGVAAAIGATFPTATNSDGRAPGMLTLRSCVSRLPP